MLDRERIEKALEIAHDGIHDGDHHKMWVIDQMVRVLTDCPMVTLAAIDAHALPYEYEAYGESLRYRDFLAEHTTWDEGTPP